MSDPAEDPKQKIHVVDRDRFADIISRMLVKIMILTRPMMASMRSKNSAISYLAKPFGPPQTCKPAFNLPSKASAQPHCRALQQVKTKKVKKTILQSITINNPSGTIGYESLSQIQEAVKFMADAVDYAQNVR